MTTEATDLKAPEINLDALSAPEGTDKDNFDNFKQKEPDVKTSNTELYGLPNLDPKPDDEKEEVRETDTDSSEGDKKPAATDQPAVKTDIVKIGNDPWFMKPFKDLQKTLELSDEEFKIPEGLTEENYLEKYNELVYEHTDFDESSTLHPEIKRLNELVSKGANVQEAIEAYGKMNNLISLGDKELVELSLKQQFGANEERKDGWDDKKIQERIQKMDNSGILEIEAEKIRNSIKQERETISVRFEERNRQQIKEQNETFAKAREEQIGKSLQYLEGLKDVYGLPVSKAEVLEFKDNFRVLVTPNDKGISPLAELLQSNENLVKVAYFLLKGDKKVKETLTKAKEDAKKGIIEKLDDKPQLTKKSGDGAAEAIDLEKLVKGSKTT
jgi:hypothetical protein